MLTSPQYQQAIRSKSALESRIRSLSKDIAVMDIQAQVLIKRNNECKEEMKLYDEVLDVDIKEYEDAHPVEEPK